MIKKIFLIFVAIVLFGDGFLLGYYNGKTVDKVALIGCEVTAGTVERMLFICEHDLMRYETELENCTNQLDFFYHRK